MGKEKIIKKIRSEGKILTCVSIPVFLFGLIICVLVIYIGNELGVAFLSVMLALLGLILLIIGIKNLFTPEKSIYVKNNPQIFEQAEQLFSAIDYEDKFVIMSNMVIANKKHILQMSYLDDVYLIYQHTESVYCIPYKKELVLETRNKKNKITINIYAKDGKKRDELFELLSKSCPNAALGYTPEGFMYLKQMREKSKEEIKQAMYRA